jgi:choline dehydrogenase-like flavoprotein
MRERKYDLVIVGAGLAGGILAGTISRLGINPKNGEPLRIAALEQGPYLKGDPKPGYGIPLRRQMFTNVTNEFRAGGRYSGARGGAAIVGGSSTHFGAVASLPTAVDFRAWQQETGVDWNEENFKESIQEIKTQFHVHKVPEGSWTRGHRLFREAAADLEYTVHSARAATKNCLYCGFCGDSRNMCKYDSKMSSLMNYIPIAEKNGVEIVPFATVKSLILEKYKAVGVNYLHRGKNLQLFADKIIVSAGTGSPFVMLATGYGPRDLLGDRLVVENPNLGRNGDGRVRVMVEGLFVEPVREGDRGWGSSSYIVDDVDPIYGVEQIFIYDQGFGEAIEPDVLALHEFSPPFGRAHKEFMRKKGSTFGKLEILCFKLKGPRGEITSSGAIRRKGFETYVKDLNRRLNQGVDIAVSILRRMGAIRLGNLPTEPLQPGGRFGASQGLCRAGADRRNSVVNEHFESHDIDNLFICDGTVLPRNPSGEDSMTTASMARFAAQRIVGRHFRR